MAEPARIADLVGRGLGASEILQYGLSLCLPLTLASVLRLRRTPMIDQPA
jgi:hypothetical protein